MPEENTMSKEVQSKTPNWPEAPNESKFWRKAKEAPFVPLGILGLIGAVTYGGIMYRRRGGMSTSVYVMKFRVIAQGMVVGAITIGMGMSIFKDMWRKNDSGKSS